MKEDEQLLQMWKELRHQRFSKDMPAKEELLILLVYITGIDHYMKFTTAVLEQNNNSESIEIIKRNVDQLFKEFDNKKQIVKRNTL